ncbi:hypothetical protein ACIRU8_39605 [Streptomyces sp. NPDC101175]|uniref:hypothetical protein n=1 Tax=Streptomyces sp. NPDC101175 TaxID=3366123 RepID=UPI003834DB7B
MSGGSYGYLFAAKDLEDLHAQRFNLEEMANRLAGLGYAQDAARETEELLVLFRQWETRAAVRIQRLADIWHAVEWWDFNDSSEDQVRDALATYRGDHDDVGTPHA